MSAPSVFISYSPKDEEWKERLQVHLAVLEHAGSLAVWDDRQIASGDDWLADIEQQLNEARIAILLVSAHFLSSPFILRKEIPRLLERRKSDGMTVIPIILKPCPWRTVGWLAAMQGGSKNYDPLSGMTEHYQEEALSNLAERIDELLSKKVIAQPASVQTPVSQTNLTQHPTFVVTPPLEFFTKVEPIAKPFWAINFGKDQYGTYAD